jgi:hypothetical protein
LIVNMKPELNVECTGKKQVNRSKG